MRFYGFIIFEFELFQKTIFVTAVKIRCIEKHFKSIKLFINIGVSSLQKFKIIYKLSLLVIKQDLGWNFLNKIKYKKHVIMNIKIKW